MKLYVSPRAPNPRRVLMFIAEKGLTGIEQEIIDIGSGQHLSAAFRARSPLAKLPVLELDDGRSLGETRAICTYLEGLVAEPNLMGKDFEERAFIEMADRRVELYLFGGIANWIRHTHPGLAPTRTAAVPRLRPLASREGARSGALAGSQTRQRALYGWTALHDRRHHRFLRSGICARADEVPSCR
jgi:glutathione S-transferase